MNMDVYGIWMGRKESSISMFWAASNEKDGDSMNTEKGSANHYGTN